PGVKVTPGSWRPHRHRARPLGRPPPSSTHHPAPVVGLRRRSASSCGVARPCSPGSLRCCEPRPPCPSELAPHPLPPYEPLPRPSSPRPTRSPHWPRHLVALASCFRPRSLGLGPRRVTSALVASSLGLSGSRVLGLAPCRALLGANDAGGVQAGCPT